MERLTFTNAARAVSIMDMMRCRETRLYRQQELLQTFGKPLISFTLNIPGEIKQSDELRLVFIHGCNAIQQGLRDLHCDILHVIETHEFTGDEWLLVVDGVANHLKQMTVNIEEQHCFGRLFDIDVISEDGSKLSRDTFRSCLLCSEQAQACARNRTHSVEELREYVIKLVRSTLN